MKYTKRFLASILTSVLVIGLASCGWGNPITIKYAHNKNEQSYTHKAALIFKEECAKLSDGAIVIEIYSNGQLGSETEARDGLIMGTVDMASVATGNMAAIANEFTIFDIPYLINTNEQVDAILLDTNSPVRQSLDKGAETAGIKVLAWADAGFRCFANNVRPIEKPEDLHGIKLRTPDWPMLMAVINHFGGVPTSMSFSEVYLGMSQGVVDGFEQPVWGIVQEKMYEIAKYVSLNNHLANDDLYCLSMNRWSSLDKQQQDVLMQAAAKATQWQTETLRADMEGYIKSLEEAGVTVTKNIDYDLWNKECSFIYDEYADNYNAELVSMIQDMKTKLAK